MTKGNRMKITVQQGDITAANVDCIIVNLFQGVTRPAGATGAVDKALGGRISDLISLGDCSGKLGATTLVHTFGALPAPRVLVVGLGDQETFDLQAVRMAAASGIAASACPALPPSPRYVHGAGAGSLDPTEAAQALTEASMLETYCMPAPA